MEGVAAGAPASLRTMYSPVSQYAQRGKQKSTLQRLDSVPREKEDGGGGGCSGMWQWDALGMWDAPPETFGVQVQPALWSMDTSKAPTQRGVRAGVGPRYR